MNGEKLLELLLVLTPEQRKLPVAYDYYNDEDEQWHHGDVDFLEVKRAHFGLPEKIHLSSL